MTRRRLAFAAAVALLVAAAAFGNASVAQAAPAQPDTLTIDDVQAYRDLSETGDLLLIAEYNIAYAVLPADTAQVNFLFRLRDSSDATIATNTPYPFTTDGYGMGVASLYLTAAQVTAASLGAWPFSGLDVLLQGNPAIFTTIPTFEFPLSSGDYSTGSGQETNQTQLTTELVSIASSLQTAWDVTLLTNEGNRIDSGTGSLYFSLAIPGILQLAPSAFAVSSETPTFEDQTFTDTLADTADARFDSVGWLNPAFDQLADDLGLPRGMLQGLGVAVLILGMGLFGQKQLGGTTGASAGFGLGIVVILPVAMWGGFTGGWAFGALAVALVTGTASLRLVRNYF